jgi:hypothetical protein
MQLDVVESVHLDHHHVAISSKPMCRFVSASSLTVPCKMALVATIGKRRRVDQLDGCTRNDQVMPFFSSWF